MRQPLFAPESVKRAPSGSRMLKGPLRRQWMKAPVTNSSASDGGRHNCMCCSGHRHRTGLPVPGRNRCGVAESEPFGVRCPLVSRRRHLLLIPPSGWRAPQGAVRLMSRTGEGVGHRRSGQPHRIVGAHVPRRSRGTSGDRTRIARSGSETEIASLLNGAHRRSSTHSTGPPARTNAKSCPF